MTNEEPEPTPADTPPPTFTMVINWADGSVSEHEAILGFELLQDCSPPFYAISFEDDTRFLVNLGQTNWVRIYNEEMQR